MTHMNIFIPLTKVDAEQRLVYGTLTEEVPDKSGEIIDYKTAKPQFARWSDEIRASSGGKSLGNVRAMHSSIAAGKLVDISFDDDAKKIEGVAKIIDDDEWNKVLEGVYTGFSLGGKYINRWPDPADPEITRYTPEPCEISIVDNPCVPTATFTLIKKDGVMELRKFRSPPAPTAAAKYGARHSKDDLARVQKLHDMAHEMQKCAGVMKATALALGAQALSDDGGDDVSPLDDDGDASPLPPADSAVPPNDGTDENPAKSFTLASTALALGLELLEKRISAIESQPLPMKGAARASNGEMRLFSVAKGAESISTAGDSLEDMDQLRDRLSALSADQRAKLMMKVALANPIQGFPKRGA